MSSRRPARRAALRTLLTVCAAAALPLTAVAQAPSGPIRILVGFPAGGTIDVVTRQIADSMRETLGVPVIVENQTGAGGQLAAQALKRAAPDGRTLMVAPDHTTVIIPLTMNHPGFDVATDFAPVGMVANYAGALAVSQTSGIKDLAGLVAQAKQQAAAGNVGVAASGSKPQFLLSALARQTGAPFVAVPYRGSVPLVQDLAGGHLGAGITALGDFLEFHRGGKLKIIAITGDKRAAVVPAVPTAAEAGHPLQMNFWVGMFAPAGTPKATLDKLNGALNQALETQAVKARMETLVFEAQKSTPAALGERVAADTRHWEPIVKASGWVKQ